MSKPMPSPASTQTETSVTRTETSSLNLYAPSTRLEIDPKYIAALEGQPVNIQGVFFDQDRDDLDYTLLINDRAVGQGTARYVDGYSPVLYTTKPGELNLGQNDAVLTVSDGQHMVSDGKQVHVDEDVAYPEKALKIPIKGIVYCPGTVEEFYQMSPTEDQMKEHLLMIKNELGCNGIRIMGDQDDMSYKCAQMAIDLEYECIVLSPFWINKTAKETVQRMRVFAKRGEELRSQYDAVQLNLVEEPSTTPRGILDDDPSWIVRTSKIPQLWPSKNWHGKYQGFLRDLIDASRDFNGKKLIGVGSWEWAAADWAHLDVDILGDSHYWYSDYGDWRDPSNYYVEHMRWVKQFRKPYYITEWGSCTYRGAWERGADAWRDAANRVYDEDEQVIAIQRYVEMLNNPSVSIDACFLQEFWDNEPSSVGEYGIIKPTTGHMWLRKKGFYTYKSLRPG
jgi:hypothetical protein